MCLVLCVHLVHSSSFLVLPAIFFLGGGLERGVEEVQPIEGELSESVGTTLGRQTLLNTATPQGLLDCNHSKAHNFKEEWEGERCKMVWSVYEKRTVENALSEREPTAYQILGLLPAGTPPGPGDQGMGGGGHPENCPVSRITAPSGAISIHSGRAHHKAQQTQHCHRTYPSPPPVTRPGALTLWVGQCYESHPQRPPLFQAPLLPRKLHKMWTGP